MPTSAAGSESRPRIATRRQRRLKARSCAAGGFTLLELLIVVAIIAIASAGVGFALRDSGQTQLEREAQRLSALLESARARSRSSGIPVRWHTSADGFAFEGLPGEPLPGDWLGSGVIAQLPQPLVLGPDPIVGAQAVDLSLANNPQRHLRVATDGVRPFAVQPVEPEAARP